MDLEDYFITFVHHLRSEATYSKGLNAWTVSAAEFEAAAYLHLMPLPAGMDSVIQLAEEGARQGFWEMDIDHELEIDIIVIP